VGKAMPAQLLSASSYLLEKSFRAAASGRDDSFPSLLSADPTVRKEEMKVLG